MRDDVFHKTKEKQRNKQMNKQPHRNEGRNDRSRSHPKYIFSLRQNSVANTQVRFVILFGSSVPIS